LTVDFRLTSFLGSAGQVAEWLKAPVSKTGIPFTRYREFESLPVRTNRPPWVPRPVQHAWCPGRCADRRGLGDTRVSGWVAEWFKAHAWKACVRESVPRVRISPHPYAPFDVTASGGALSFRQIHLWCPFVVSVRAAPQASPLARREEFGARLHRPLRMSTTTPEARHAFVRDRGRLLFRHSPPPCSMSRPASGAHSP
jgi:hypothetical protein